MKTNSKLSCLLFITALFSACSGDNSYKEPDKCIDGYGVEQAYDRWIPIEIEGKQLFEDKMLTDDKGEQFKGSRMHFKSIVDCCINGFYRIKNGHNYILFGNTLTNDGKPNVLGPYDMVGMFYEDVTPAVKEGEGIGYIDRNGDVVFWLDKVLGKKGKIAYNFMGGLSVVGTPVTNDGITIYGAIDTKGNTIIPFDYFKLEYAGSGLWYAENLTKNAEKDYDDWVADIIDRNGNVIISFPRKDFSMGTFMHDNGNHGPHQFAFSGDYSLLINYSGDNWKIIDREGNVLAENIDGIKPSGEHYHGNFIFKDKKNHKYGIMAPNGEIKIEAQFTKIIFLSDEVFCARKNKRYYIYDYSGEIKLEYGDFGSSRPLAINKNYLLVQKIREIEIFPLDDTSNKEIINGGGMVTYYDQRLMDKIYSSTNEMWMP